MKFLRTLGVLSFATAAPFAWSQTEGAAFNLTGSGAATTFATDYQCIGINPSNLGWAGQFELKKITFGVAEVGYSIYSDAFTKDALRSDFVKPLLGAEADKFTFAEKQQAAKNFTNTALAMNGDVRAVGFSIATAKAGGFAFHIADRYQWFSTFNQASAEILFLGRMAPYFQNLELSDGSIIANDPNLPANVRDQVVRGFNLPGQGERISRIYKDGVISQSWVREYALSWGYPMGTTGVVEWFGGVGARYLTGLAYSMVRSDGSDWEAFTALSPGFDIDYGEAGKKNPSTVTGDSYSPVGTGFSGDIGFSTLIAKVAKVGISYTNIGSITWDGNVYEAKDDTLYSLDSPGFNTYNIFNEAELIQAENGVFNWTGLKEQKMSTPSQLRTGASFAIKQVAEVGLDVIIPTNDAAGNYEKAVMAAGGQWFAAPWLVLSAGVVNGGNMATRLPLGVTFRSPSGSWEGGVHTRDSITLVSQNNPHLSAVLGFLRFRV
ncbi:MAG: hypothetical protein JNM31_06310 [Flavobacteriales bacterium]|nr:hypothetical protein [Flavobacteriales bacterium]